MMSLKTLSWGRPTIKIGKLQANGDAPTQWIDVPTPVQDTTKLTPSKGEKQEAKVEGGDNEAVKYAANNYAFEFEIRKGKGEAKPVEDQDGVIAGNYAIKLQPEDPTVEGIMIDNCVLSVEESYDAKEGLKLKYTADVLRPKTGAKVKLQVVTFG